MQFRIDGYRLQKLVRIAGEAVFATELTTAVRVDAVGDQAGSPRDVAVQNTAHLKRLEFDEVTVVCVPGAGGHPGDSDWLLGKNREEFGSA
jgi:hypothetical protein